MGLNFSIDRFYEVHFGPMPDLRVPGHSGPPELTVLTSNFEPSTAKRFQKALMGVYGYLRGVRLSARGPEAVLGSIIRGTRLIGVNLIKDPRSSSQITAKTLVLSGGDTLRKSLDYKHEGKIERLLAGPNLFVFPTEQGGVLTDPGIDAVIVPCEWVRKAYESQAPALEGRVKVWASGVDTTFFQRQKAPIPKRILIYQKNAPESLVLDVECVLTQYKWDVQMIRYGTYSPWEYRAALETASLGIFLSQSESQGIALAEAWAMDVPTLIWDPGELVLAGWRFEAVTSCPYLSAQTGRRWQTIQEFRSILQQNSKESYAPRDWVLENMSDEVCAARLLAIISKVSRTNDRG